MPEIDFSFLSWFIGLCLVVLFVSFLAILVPWWMWVLLLVGFVTFGILND